MKQILLVYLLMALPEASHAQDFQGVFAGAIFSEKNVVTITTHRSALIGTVFINTEEKFFFNGVVNGSEITGTMSYASKVWVFKGNVFKDSLLFTLTSDYETKKVRLKKISSGPDKNIQKFLPPAQRDKRLNGEWVLRKRENVDGSLKNIDEEYKGASYRFSSNGSLYIDFPNTQLRKKFPGRSPPQQNWSTDGSTLIIENKFKTSTVQYSIQSDTLILYPATEKMYFVKEKMKK